MSKTRDTMFVRIFGVYLAVIVPLTGLILLFSFTTIREHYIESITDGLKRLNYSVSQNISTLLGSGDELNETIRRLGRETNSRITIISPRGEVLADSEMDPKKMENHATRTEVEQALSRGFGSSLRHSETVNEDMLYVAAPLKINGEIAAVTRVSLFIRGVDDLNASLRHRIIKIVLVILIISLVIIFIFSRNLTKPINELTNAARNVSAGDFDTKVFAKSKGEIKELAGSFNEMTIKVKELIAQTSSQKDELDGVVSSLQEGLAVLDAKGKILLCNESFRKIVDKEDLVGKNYWEALRDVEVGKLIDKARKGKKNKEAEISAGDGYYLCGANYIAAKDEIALILHDITEKKKLESVKRDFVVNTSHELRTPLTSIKGYIEALDDVIAEKNKGLLTVIKRNTDRMIDIVRDLLTLSELEERDFSREFSRVDLKEPIGNALNIFEQKSKKKGLYLTSDIADDLPQVEGDAYKLEEMIVNLVDNAIKHTDEGGVAVSAKAAGGDVVVEVSDTGAGIPKTSLGRIFERFYTVDKSRSRATGGTGLGLSIVKHIVKTHKGRIEVESALKKGTTFRITLPAGAPGKKDG